MTERREFPFGYYFRIVISGRYGRHPFMCLQPSAPVPITIFSAVERRDTTQATARRRSRRVVHSAKRMAMLRRRASERRTSNKVEQVGRHHSFMVVMQLLLSLHTVIIIIVCRFNSRGCKVGCKMSMRVRYLSAWSTQLYRRAFWPTREPAITSAMTHPTSASYHRSQVHSRSIMSMAVLM